MLSSFEEGSEDICMSNSVSVDEDLSITSFSEHASTYSDEAEAETPKGGPGEEEQATRPVFKPLVIHKPVGSFKLDEACISDFEREALPEFFRTSGSRHTSKTPARYMAIRQNILDIYRSEYAGRRYLNKLTCRKRLIEDIKGDSGCFSRVHEFLESVGAINRDFEGKAHVKKTEQPIRTPHPEHVLHSKSERKRKIRDEDGEWVEEGLAKTIEHRNSPINRPVRVRKKVIGDGFEDPFKLVPPLNYPSDTAPLKVSISREALFLMRVHALLSTNEVIGLLGGTLDPKQQLICISRAAPCQSVASTGTECDMDPVSEMAACEYFQSLGLSMFGWYHSHPNFDPIPSIRDIETQTVYQGLFRSNLDAGIEPFVGFIVSPPDAIECVHVSEVFDVSSAFRLPYRLEYIIKDEGDVSALRNSIQKLLADYQQPALVDEFLDRMISSG